MKLRTRNRKSGIGNLKLQSRNRRRYRCNLFLSLGTFVITGGCISSLLWAGLGRSFPKGRETQDRPAGIVQAAIPSPAKADPPIEEMVSEDMPLETEPMQHQIQDHHTDEPWNLALVNSKHPIPDNYSADLTEVPGGERVDARIYEPLMEMLEDAREGNLGELPLVVSGYRTQEDQQALYDDKISKYKKQGYSDSDATELAKQWVAVPGYSEHQIGLAVDINGAAYDVYLWLQENSYKYGFIFRYPGNKTDITEVSEEVWHYRYVGTKAAKEIYERGICLEEYLAEQNPIL